MVRTRSQRKSNREARALVWTKIVEANQANPDATPEQLAGAVAADLQENGETYGFDVSTLLELLVTLLPLILSLFKK